MYDSSTQRFITEDPVKSGINWYVYCGNSPIKNIDTTGCEATISTPPPKDPTYITMPPGLPSHPTEYPDYTGSVKMYDTTATTGPAYVASITVSIYVPKIVDGANIVAVPIGLETAHVYEAAWSETHFNLWEFLFGIEAQGSDALLNGSGVTHSAKVDLASAAINSFNNSVHIKTYRLKATTAKNGHVGSNHVTQTITIELGMDVSQIQSKAGSYFILLKCVISDDMKVKRNLARRKIAQMYGNDNDYYDYKISYDKARETDPYFYYLFIGQDGKWKAYPKKNAEDKLEIVKVNYFLSWDASYTSIYNISTRMYDRVYTLSDQLKDKVVQQLNSWNINI